MTYQDKSESLANEIEITPEMIEAGLLIFNAAVRFEEDEEEAVINIFRAMMAVMQRASQRLDNE